MKVFLLILLALNPINDIKKIARVNALKEEASKAYNAGDYQKAAQHYSMLVDSLNVQEDALRLNLANSFFQLNDAENAGRYYQSLADSEIASIKSAAAQQLGVMANREGKFQEALSHFKQAIKADPKNDDARFNYEMLKKKLKEQQEQDQQEQENDQQNQQDKKDQDKDQNKDQQHKQDQDKDKNEDQDQDKQQQQDKNDKDKEQKENENESDQDEEQKQDEQTPPSTSDKLKDMKISEEQARKLLEAMKNQEVQYLQQNKRKATQRKDPSKPDW
ncbi:MAG TPA: hypothetical protein PKC24_13840 [Cyclobacteriaceae bacterium]|nr:hypothetical protein [Cyclobacteriaceae bacterium]